MLSAEVKTLRDVQERLLSHEKKQNNWTKWGSICYQIVWPKERYSIMQNLPKTFLVLLLSHDFFLRKVKKESAETHIFPSAVCSLSGWKLSLKSPPPHLRNRHLGSECEQIHAVVKQGSSAAKLLLQSVSQPWGRHCQPKSPARTPSYPFPFLPPVAACDEAQPVPCWWWSRPRWRLWCFLLPSPCWMLVLLLSNVFLCVLHGAENKGAACSLLKAVPIPPGMKNATSKNPQVLKWLPPSRSFPDSWRMRFTVIFPSHIFQRRLPSPSDHRFGQTFTSTEKHLREVNTQGLEDWPLASILGNGFPHSLGLTSAIDTNYDN